MARYLKTSLGWLQRSWRRGVCSVVDTLSGASLRRSHARTSSSVPLFDFVSHVGFLFVHMLTMQKPRPSKASREWAPDKARSERECRHVSRCCGRCNSRRSELHGTGVGSAGGRSDALFGALVHSKRLPCPVVQPLSELVG